MNQSALTFFDDAKAKATQGWNTLGIQTQPQNLGTLAELARGFINLMPVEFVWKNATYTGAIDIGGATDTLGIGGITPMDFITLHLVATDFTDGLPKFADQLTLFIRGQEVYYQVKSDMQVIDGNDQSFTITAEVIADESDS